MKSWYAQDPDDVVVCLPHHKDRDKIWLYRLDGEKCVYHDAENTLANRANTSSLQEAECWLEEVVDEAERANNAMGWKADELQRWCYGISCSTDKKLNKPEEVQNEVDRLVAESSRAAGIARRAFQLIQGIGNCERGNPSTWSDDTEQWFSLDMAPKARAVEKKIEDSKDDLLERLSQYINSMDLKRSKDKCWDDAGSSAAPDPPKDEERLPRPGSRALRDGLKEWQISHSVFIRFPDDYTHHREKFSRDVEDVHQQIQQYYGDTELICARRGGDKPSQCCYAVLCMDGVAKAKQVVRDDWAYKLPSGNGTARATKYYADPLPPWKLNGGKKNGKPWSASLSSTSKPVAELLPNDTMPVSPSVELYNQKIAVCERGVTANTKRGRRHSRRIIFLSNGFYTILSALLLSWRTLSNTRTRPCYSVLVNKQTRYLLSGIVLGDLDYRSFFRQAGAQSGWRRRSTSRTISMGKKTEHGILRNQLLMRNASRLLQKEKIHGGTCAMTPLI
ncbi:unnamed protein product [Amoebophrya sp. A120]|nr:unnamed protein product [Amoebophrya sp. A120]|eukprot:GSA120T00005686001.1